jgi:hypothetical protein
MFYLPTQAPDDWKTLLDQPEVQWRTGYPAKAVAACWEEARGLPKSVRDVFRQSGLALFRNAELVAGFPEHRTAIPPVSAEPSRTDLLVLARSGDALISIAVEAKVTESSGVADTEWESFPEPARQERLAALCGILELDERQVDGIHYRLLDRAAVALLEAERFCAPAALMMVHSFSQVQRWFNEYAKFAGLFTTSPQPEAIVHAGRRYGRELYLAWVTGEVRYLNR